MKLKQRGGDLIIMDGSAKATSPYVNAGDFERKQNASPQPARIIIEVGGKKG